MPVLPGDDAYTWTAGDGTVLDLTDRTRWLVLPGDGFGLSDLHQATRDAPYQPGALWVFTRPQPRHLILRLLVRASTYTQQLQLRQQLVTAFSPWKGLGTLTITRADGSVRTIRAVPDSKSLLFNAQGRKGLSRLEEITLFCPSPFWTDGTTQTVSAPLGTASGAFSRTLPFALPTTASQLLGTVVTLTSGGDWETPLVTTITGMCMNPTVVNATVNSSWTWQNTIPAGYALVVTTSATQPSVVLVDPLGNRTQAFNWLTSTSTLWLLPPGASTVVVRSAGASQGAQVTFQWANLYSGI